MPPELRRTTRYLAVSQFEKESLERTLIKNLVSDFKRMFKALYKDGNTFEMTFSIKDVTDAEDAWLYQRWNLSDSKFEED